MKLNLIKTTEDESRRIVSTRIEKTFQINPVITVEVDAYINLTKCNFSELWNLECVDWCIEYYIGGEKCRREGVKELLNKLFTDLSYDKIEDAIREYANNERNFAGDLPYNTLQGLSESEAQNLLNSILAESPILPTTNSGCTFIYNWEIITLGRLANDPRIQQKTVLSDYELKRIAGGTTMSPRERTVFVLNAD